MVGRRAPRDPALVAVLAERARLRAEYDVLQEHAYTLAETETNGVMLNRRGKAAGINPWSLFSGTWVRAQAYASEELLDHWVKHPRVTWSQFERQAVEHPGAASNQWGHLLADKV